MNILDLKKLLDDCYKQYGDLEIFVKSNGISRPFSGFIVEDYFIFNKTIDGDAILVINA
jgi:hypothetical protein